MVVFLFFLDYQGFFFIVESDLNFYFFFLRLVTFYLVLLLTNDFFCILMGFFLVLLSFLFFFVWSLLLFFVFFELSSIPVVLMTLFYGVQVEKVSSVFYLLFYSFLTGLPFFLFLLFFFVFVFDFNLVYLDFKLNCFFSVLVSLSFLIKFPVYFLHFWLPKVHVEASTLASILLAGLLLKFGVLGFYRVFYVLKLNFFGFFFIVVFIGIVLGRILSLIQSDLKSLVAFSSVCHLSFTLLGFLVFNDFGKSSFVFSSLGHGFLRVLSFWFAGEVYHQVGSRLVYFSGSIFGRDYFFCLLFGVSNFLSCSTPLSLGYFSEYSFFLNIFFFDFFYFFLVIYFFFDFYMSVYLFILFFIGKKIKVFFCFLLLMPLVFLLISCSFFSFF